MFGYVENVVINFYGLKKTVTTSANNVRHIDRMYILSSQVLFENKCKFVEADCLNYKQW